GASRRALRRLYRERLASGRAPLPRLGRARRARDDLDALGHEVRAVETDAKLPDDGDVLLRALLELFEKCRGARLRDGAEVLDELSLGHSDARVFDDEHLLLRLDAEPDDEGRIPLEQRGLGDGPEAELVERVGRVRDELTQEDLLVRVERIDDERQDSADLGLKRMRSHLAEPPLRHRL